MVSRWLRGGRAILLGVLAIGVWGCVATGAPATKPVVRGQAPAPAGASAADIEVLVSDDVPAYAQVASALAAQLGNSVPVRNLHGDSARVAKAREQLQASSRNVVIAIGMLAADTARGLRGKSVVFCQVFNYQDANLVQPWMKGVSALPPAAESFRAWRKLDPRVRRIGLITGTNLDQVHADGRAAARAIGAEIDAREVESDRGALFAFNRLVPEVDGFWLVPDNRILSSEVLRDVLALSVKHGKPVIVFSEDMLRIGGLLSAEAEPPDVAAQVLRRVREIGADGAIPGAAVIPLTRARITVNRVVARELGLIGPEPRGGKGAS
jgi:ABC-type uncharacterized transport system substrate-binding protein